ncbi:MAG: HAD-IB family hydrolase [Gammaproteobacteria bacterium]|uniref:HAD family hydrolase n=1 Tax=Rhodoferax sp. TaxID=50421 RepID=UPI0018412210|nr:HAD family hydrolase [Rhodoferax sp.]MBU3899700.1 HAD-IB family hydrolase [Gammaproteobacteria bacterium]MBA3058352.1 HAD family hydrolase [Rhodoferax sp.]MBU3996267.1 HAD-IB family hydrolase [Gammaproteobacteria bacterium]MBU4018176.1 HAD-IB family hydrolase [Gammaproteobacteria bacterium]MBU4080133.1 HAD-IB family hydrolase [Gammaproteobacteria bacterium]
MKLTLFDLDHTLLPIDSDHAWGVFTSTLGWTDPVDFNQRNDEFFAHYQAGTLDIRAYVRFATAALREQGAIKAQAAHVQFMQAVVGPAIKQQALALLRQHQQAGDAVLIVTATNDFVTRPIAQALGVDELIATQLAVDTAPGGSGWITGEIVGVPSFREGKITRVTQWLASRQLDWSDVETTFYSDSMNDLSLLERVIHPVATNPDAPLRALAQARGWRILDLF